MLVVLLLPFFVTCVLGFDGRPQLQYDIEKAEDYFQWFVKTHNKTYHSKSEEKMRFTIFKHNLEQINEKNSANGYHIYGVNSFADKTAEEFIKGHTGLKDSEQGRHSTFCTLIDEDSIKLRTLPSNFDWRTYGKVTPVKTQNCGSCWAFATIGNVESLNAIKTNTLLDLSEQELVDCDYLDCGCCGGYPENALSYLNEVGVVMTKYYPQTKHQGVCNKAINKPRVLLDGCLRYDFTDEEKVRQVLVDNGPLILGIDVHALQLHYTDSHGIIECSPTISINHAVLLIGYGEENDVPYWIMKNSWGSSWGDEGYFRVKRGVNACGMLDSFICSAIIA